MKTWRACWCLLVTSLALAIGCRSIPTTDPTLPENGGTAGLGWDENRPESAGWPRTDFGEARSVELHPPRWSRSVVLESETADVYVDAQRLLERIDRGGAWQSEREQLEARSASLAPVRLSLANPALVHIACRFLDEGRAAVVRKADGRRFRELIVVSWTTRPRPQWHASGGIEYRFPDGGRILNVSTWIE